MMKKRIVFAGAIMLGFAAFAGGYGSKIIYHGWDVGLATPAEVLRNADKFDKLAIDGISLKLNGPEDNSTVDQTYVRGQFDSLIPIYRQIVAHKSLKFSFLLCGTMPYKRGVRYAWTNDVEWARISANFRELARLAKSGGLKGLMIDNEDYVGSRQFYHNPATDGDWDTATKLVRERGRTFFRGIFEEFPDITLFFFWTFIDNEFAHLSDDPEGTLRASGRLTCAFLNGMLDVMPSTASFVEGNENAYTYEAYRGDFDRHAVEVLSDMVKVVAPENRTKYRAHVRNGFALYLDEFVNEPTRVRKGKVQPNHWYRGARNGSRAEHFRENLEAAVKAADEYVWVYGERFSAIDWDDTLDQSKWSLKFNAEKTWDETIGLSRKIKFLHGKNSYVSTRIAEIVKEGKEPNLLPNADAFEVTAQGTNAVTKTFTFVDMTNRVPYALDVQAKGDVRVAAYWLRDGKWCLDVSPTWFVEAERMGEKDAQGWQRYSAVVSGPKDIDTLVIQFTARTGTAQFRNAAFCRFDSDAPAGRYVPDGAKSGADVLKNPVIKKKLDEHPDYWRMDDTVIVIQKSVQFFDQMTEIGSK